MFLNKNYVGKRDGKLGNLFINVTFHFSGFYFINKNTVISIFLDIFRCMNLFFASTTL